MADVQMPDGNVAKIPDFALDSTAQLILKQLTDLNKTNSTKFKELVDNAKEEAKKTEKFRKDDESDREDLYKATLDISKAIRDGNKSTVDKNNTPSISIGPDISPTLSRLSGGAVQASANIDKMGAGAGATSDNVGNLGTSADAARQQMDNFNKGAAIGEKAFVMFYDGAMGAAKAITAAFVVYGGILVDSFLGLGDELNKLTKVGAGFADGLSAGGMSAAGAMVQLSGMGLNAVGVMSNFSSVMQSMGKAAFVDMTRSFLDATEAGADLGMSLDDSAERLGAELQKRQLMGALDGVNQAKLQKQITVSIRNQQKYATALGTSTDELVAFSDSLLQQTPALTSNLMRLNGDLRSQVIGGITDFGTAMRAMGGEEGGQIAAAMTEAAASGAMGFSDSMTGYVTALPSLAGPMNQYIKAIQDGTLSQEQADEMAQDITKQLANVSAAEKNRIFALARAGDAQAESMAKAITQFEQSEKKLKDINKGYTMDGVQKGTNVLTAIMKGFSGTLEALKTSFLVGLGNVGPTGEALSDTFNNARDTIMRSVGKAMESLGFAGGAFDNLTKGGESLGKALGEQLPGIIETVAVYVGKMIEKIPAIIEGVKNFASGVMTVFKVLSTIFSVAMIPLKFAVGVIEGIAATLGLIGNTFMFVLKLIGSIAGVVVDLVLLPFKAIGALIGTVWDFISAPFRGIGDAVSDVGDTISSAGSMLLAPFKFIGSALQSAGKALSKAFDYVLAPFKFIGSMLTSTGGALSSAFGFVLAPFKWFGSAIGKVFDVIMMPFEWLGKTLKPTLDRIMAPFAWFGEKLSGFASTMTDGGLVSVLGKFTGALGVAAVGMKALGIGMPKMMSGLADTMLKGAGKATELLGKGLSKATGGLSDKLGGWIKGKLPGGGGGGGSESPAGDLGAGAMEKAGKASQRLTKTIANGMKDISKGISDMLTNLSKGVSNAIANLSKGISSAIGNVSKGISTAITSLSKAIGTAGASIGKGIGGLLQGALTGLGKGLEAVGNPKALLGAGAMLVISGSMYVAAKAFEIFGDLSWEAIGKGFVTLLGLGAVATVLGLAMPFIIPGAIAIGALGLALVPFAIAAAIAAPAIETLFNGLASIKDVPISSMFALGPALIGMAVGMAALSAGGLISGLMDGLGSLFGAESPFDKIAKIGQAAPHIVAMTDSMNNMGSTVETFNKAIKQIDGAGARDQFGMLAEGVQTLAAAMEEVSVVDLMKMAAMKAFSAKPEAEPEAEPEQKPGTKKVKELFGNEDILGPSKKSAIPTHGFTHDPEDPYAAPTYFGGEENAESSREKPQAQKKRSEMTPYERTQARLERLSRSPQAQTAEVTPKQGQEQVKTTQDKPVADTATAETGGEQKSTGGITGDLRDVLEQMVKNQQQTNRLLQKGNRTQVDIADNL